MEEDKVVVDAPSYIHSGYVYYISAQTDKKFVGKTLRWKAIPSDAVILGREFTEINEFGVSMNTIKASGISTTTTIKVNVINPYSKPIYKELL